jgi:hypothetical protein
MLLLWMLEKRLYECATCSLNLLSELGYEFDSLSVLRMDNNSAIAVAKNPEKFSHVKHTFLLFDYFIWSFSLSFTIRIFSPIFKVYVVIFSDFS